MRSEDKSSKVCQFKLILIFVSIFNPPMKYTFLVFFLLLCSIISSQNNITVDSQSLNPQQLIEDVLIDSDCIENVVVTNAVSGDFNGAEFSYGTFDATGTTFPFERGIVLSTGRLSNVPGPNDSLSDDDAPGWGGDNDLEVALDESNTFNATILEFDFIAITEQVSFRYIFASEEYQEGNPNSCVFSDLFGFLIRPTGTSDPYENIALVPGTSTPVKATTVTPGVAGSCPPQNEIFFGNYNGVVAPINFNGQTDILTATATIIPGESYHVKLVIADEQNFRFDSAVFLEAGSFNLSVDLGLDRLLATDNPLCEDDILTLNAFIDGGTYIWYRDGIPQNTMPCAACFEFEVSEAGTYAVEVFLGGSCVANGEVVIEYSQNPIITDIVVTECDLDQDGLTFFNLIDAVSEILNNNPDLSITNFFLSEAAAMSGDDPIQNPEDFENTIVNQVVFVKVENNFGCFDIAEIELRISNNILTIPLIEACDFGELDGLTTFNLDEVNMAIANQIPVGAVVSFFENENDAFSDRNALPINYENSIPDAETIFVKVESGSDCYAISEVNLSVKFTPEISEDETIIYCTDTFPETIRLLGGVLNDLPNNYFYEWQLNGTTLVTTTSFIDINETGIYTVIITDPNGCSATRDITVLPSSIVEINDIDVIGVNATNTIIISVSGSGDYEYNLDFENGFYQDENVFSNINPGFHTVYVRDKNGCGIVSQIFSVLGFPKFFTPNGDGQNDFWKLDGVNFDLYPNLIVSIYNRFGKLITTQDANSSGWDGSYNGNKLPNTDYWFTANFGNGQTFTGHFALKR